jgi:hypothetical protein
MGKCKGVFRPGNDKCENPNCDRRNRSKSSHQINERTDRVTIARLSQNESHDQK